MPKPSIAGTCPNCGSPMAAVFAAGKRTDFCGKCDDPYKSRSARGLVNAKELQPPKGPTESA
jgi:hypothetical protein